MSETAFERVTKMANQLWDSGDEGKEQASLAIGAGINEYLHPQDRTRAFHQFYGAPIKDPSEVTHHFEYMDNRRAAFRLSFILSEAFELLEKGFGIKVALALMPILPKGSPLTRTEFYTGDSDGDLCEAVECVLNAQNTERRNIIEVADALGDLNVVVNGFGLELGLDMNAIDREIMASNFTKPDENGKPIIGDGVTGPHGKVLKGPNYMEPNLSAVIFGKGE